ncbi:hypothetical protein EXIGLDRAFT_760579 [Exidia glandulosa HHB12029]|uniref:RNI-like protein n=1 Tax=Exidia glandulosa HHB12029 TaxID=1314781 RepID=A0A165P501_EXIGL|nr:hypothetical protein EXIGLDRAFT_760579 [Exidia glandulosa HHB12029]
MSDFGARADCLRVFESQLRNVFLAAPRPPLNHLRILRVVFNTTPLHVILDSLRLVPYLEELRLHIHSAPAPTALPQTLVGVSLKRLAVLEYGLFNDSVRQFAALIDAPALRSLTVQMRLLPDDNMDAVLNRMSDSLTDLTINDGRLDVDSLPILRGLKCLEVLAIKSSTCITDAFFHAIAEDPLCFPRLRSVTLADTACIEPDDGGGLETLLRERNGTGTRTTDAAFSPSRITEVALSSASVPDWLKAHVRHLI